MAENFAAMEHSEHAALAVAEQCEGFDGAQHEAVRFVTESMYGRSWENECEQEWRQLYEGQEKQF